MTALAADLALALDPVALADRVGLDPDKWQRDVLRSTARRVLLNCCRQSGKSTTTAVLACHTALYEPDSLILVLSPGERQSKETLRKVVDVYRAVEQPVKLSTENTLELELTNGSRIVALPGNEARIRGYSGVRLLIVDEASRVPDALYGSVRPMLAVSGGRLVALSTPWGRRGWFYAAWEAGGTDWHRVKITAHECPRIAPAFLEEERRALPSIVYRSEYECLFEDAVDAYFSSLDIQAGISDEVQPLFAVVGQDAGDDVTPLWGGH